MGADDERAREAPDGGTAVPDQVRRRVEQSLIDSEVLLSAPLLRLEQVARAADPRSP